MRSVEGKTGKWGFSFSYTLLIIAIVAYAAVRVYSSYAAEWKARADSPQIDPILKIIKGLTQYQKLKATFPPGFHQVEAAVWKHSNPPDYGLAGRSVLLRNYYYFYTLISPSRCTVWAIPTGPHKDEANSYFLVLTPDGREKWKGPALNLNEAAVVSGTPTYAQLAMLGMIKQESPPEKKR